MRRGIKSQRAQATYTVEGDELHFGRSIDGEERIQGAFALPEDYVMQPGGYIFFGYALPHLVERAPLAMISRYSMMEPPENSFMAGKMYPTVTFYGEAEVTVEGKVRAARQYVAGERGTDGTNWHSYYVDEKGVFLWHESDRAQVKLERYAHTS